MSSHFLLKSEARTLSLKEIFKLTDDEAFEMFKNMRWKDGKPICPKCACEDYYFISTRKLFKCKSCHHQYSVTSGTIFADRKLPLQDYLGAIAIYTNGAKGYTMLQLSRDLNVQYKTAFVLSHKLREAILNHRSEEKLEGEVEMDVAWFGGYIKPENKKEDRIDRRKSENQSDKKRAVLTIRKRSLDEKQGAIKTLTFVIKTENQEDINKIVEQYLNSGVIINADESPAYDLLHARFEMKRINHKFEYFNYETGACTNQAESFFSRMRRSQLGQHHKMSPEYLSYYAYEIAYREDTRRWDNKSIFTNIFFCSLHSPMSKRMRGYWNRNRNKNFD